MNAAVTSTNEVLCQLALLKEAIQAKLRTPRLYGVDPPNARQESARTIGIYDRRNDFMALDEIKRIAY